MKVDISPLAYEDLESIRKHIEEKLYNPSSARNILMDILDSIKSLDKLPDRGALLNTLLSVKSDYRFIQSHNYVIFYRNEESRVLVVRVLYKHQNFMKVFFNDEVTLDVDDENIN